VNPTWWRKALARAAPVGESNGVLLLAFRRLIQAQSLKPVFRHVAQAQIETIGSLQIWEIPMPVKDKKYHPALKHAGYATTGILPGENEKEFEKQHRDLIAEFSPNGALENDIIATMARLVWRKQNTKTFRIAELARECFEQIKRETVPGYVFDYPKLEFGAVNERVDPAEREAAIRAAEDQARKELGDAYGLVEIEEIASADHLMKDLEVQDRLDAMIDKCLKRSLFVRGLKSISGASTSAPRGRLAGPSRAE